MFCVDELVIQRIYAIALGHEDIDDHDDLRDDALPSVLMGKAEFLPKGENPRFVVTSLSPRRAAAKRLYFASFAYVLMQWIRQLGARGTDRSGSCTVLPPATETVEGRCASTDHGASDLAVVLRVLAVCEDLYPRAGKPARRTCLETARVVRPPLLPTDQDDRCRAKEVVRAQSAIHAPFARPLCYIYLMSTIALYKALIEAGASEASAERAVEGLPPSGELATKAELKAELAMLETRLLRWNSILAGVIIATVGLIVKL